ncbi:MAG TPA: PSD1 and planctomycete cytochrome C domain-containing protein [Humisphaera sp.]|jgi:hypothetical protein|nr:PSD1 and planctomycete cytochrome C domain-containing protein [Humisphaera sp.]
MMRWILLFVSALALTSATYASDSSEGLALFEQHIRPLLVERCYQCHSAKAEKVKGKLWLDSRQGVAKGGAGGPVLVPGQPEKSRLIEAIHWTDPELKMPPKEQLSAQQIQWFEAWVKLGAPDPREPVAGAPVVAEKRGMDLETGRKWWAFQPVMEISPPVVSDESWVQRKTDQFVLAKLEEVGLKPSPPADRRTLITRAYLDLTGLRPTYDEVEAFAKDDSPGAYEKLIDRLLASDHYGERWGRYWLDVVRYAEDNPTSEATNPPYGFAWRYRDWVIGALNQDVPYDRFVKLQLAADEMPGTSRQDLVALGFLGAGPVYHKDGRLSKDVIETLCNDDWDERIDTVTRGFLGMTVACARCHDHKFDPITTKDYYSLQGIFASIVQVPRPLAEVEPGVEARFMAAEQRLFYLSYVANLMRGEPGSKPKEARQKVERFAAEIEQIKQEMSFLKDKHPEMYAQLDQLGRPPQPYPDQPTTRPVLQVASSQAPSTQPGRRRGAATGAANAVAAGNGRRGGRGGSTAPFFQAVFDAGTYVDGSDPDLTMIDIHPGEARDMHVLPGGNVARPGDVSPRRFLAVLSKDDATFHDGSGRRELAEKIFTDGKPLAARVIVNRVWAWHFGKPLVATQSDFGAQGEKPTHPQLLDDLAARFIANGWSMKWLHKEIMLSAAYRQASHPRDDAMAADPTNRLIWRMSPRRLDVEAMRDCILQASGTLDEKMFGVSMDADQPGNNRRTVYARVARGRLNNLFQLFDFPEATMHSPGREVTTTPLQQLFAMNSAFMQNQAAALAKSVEKRPQGADRVRAMYHQVFSRDPSEEELKLAADYLSAGGTTEQYAQALLNTNEVLFWP